jgi:hypothetical protein
MGPGFGTGPGLPPNKTLIQMVIPSQIFLQVISIMLSVFVLLSIFRYNRWLHLYFSLKLHNIQNEHFSVLKKCKICFKFNGNVLFCHYGSILDSDKSCNPGRTWCIVLRVLENWHDKIWSSISFLLLNIIDSNFGQLEISVYKKKK